MNAGVIHALDEGVGIGANGVFWPNFLIISFFPTQCCRQYQSLHDPNIRANWEGIGGLCMLHEMLRF